MNELPTIDELDVTQLSKKKLLEYFALTISQEQPSINKENILMQKWKVMTCCEESLKYKEINKMSNNYPNLSLEELLSIRDNFIKKDTEKLNEIQKEIQQYEENRNIIENEYRDQRKILTVNSLIKHLGYKSTNEFEKRFIGEAKTATPQGMGCLSTIIAIATGIILYNFPPFELLDVSKGYGKRAVFFIAVCMVISFLALPTIYVLSKKIIWQNKISKASNINTFLENLPLDLKTVNYGVENGKPSYKSWFKNTVYNYPSTLDYSVTLNLNENNSNLERAKILEEHISLWENNGEEFLISVKNYFSELRKISTLKKSNRRLGEAMPEQWTKNTSKGIIETSLIFSNILSSGRADTWKEAANLTIEDKFKQTILRELENTRQAMINTMIETGDRIRESLSEEVYKMANDVSSSIEAEGIRNQLAMSNVNNSLDRIEVINSAIFIGNLLN